MNTHTHIHTIEYNNSLTINATFEKLPCLLILPEKCRCNTSQVFMLLCAPLVTAAMKDMQSRCPIAVLCVCCSSPVVQFLFIFKHPKRFHSITKLLSVLVVYFSWGCKANGRSDAIVFLRLLPTRHGAAREHGNKAQYMK